MVCKFGQMSPKRSGEADCSLIHQNNLCTLFRSIAVMWALPIATVTDKCGLVVGFVHYIFCSLPSISITKN